MTTKYFSRVMIAAIILLVVVAGALLGLYGDFNTGFADARGFPESSQGISQCPQAEYGEGGLVSNGRSTDQQDLYSRHQECSQAFSWTVAPNPQILDVYLPTVKVQTIVYVTNTNSNSQNSPGGNSSGPEESVKQDDGTKTEDSGKACKNKNSGKDGTPSECNAGKGQEKK